jgi:phenylalanyl-tRNA synthetase beta chain
VNALKRTVLLIKELAGGEIASELVDVYPDPANKTQVILKHHYLKKLSGKNYHPDTVKTILSALGFEIIKEGMDAIHVAVPWHKPDVSLPADIVEEIMRIDGLDNIAIPSAITISPSVEKDRSQYSWRSAVASYLVGQGFNEILTNSITNSAYFSQEELTTSVKMINNLSAELNIMRPSLLETGLESIAFNLNRKNTHLQFFEFGKSYATSGVGNYTEALHLCLYVTGSLREDAWKAKGAPSDFYYLKGLCERIFRIVGLEPPGWGPPIEPGTKKQDEMQLWEVKEPSHPKLSGGVSIAINGRTVLEMGAVKPSVLQLFDCKQELFFADIRWDVLMELAVGRTIEFRELPKQLPVQRDLAMIVGKSLPFEKVEKTIRSIRLSRLQEIKLFDIFESEKLGADKKSLAVSFTFLDEEKTLTDKEIDGMVGKIMGALEKELNVEIRK